MTAPFDPYRALGVRPDATDAEVKAAHRRLAKRFHPDAGGDHDRFLRVQEAYKVLSDPLRRRDWDAKHAPGPVRADVPGTPRRPRTATRRSARTSTPPPQDGPARDGAAESQQDDPVRRPRSRRAYTWSASDVPWWEEGVSENRRQPGRKRPARTGPRRGAGETPADAPPRPPEPAEPPNPFDVYNRSSGAAWSMAARAYFRRGDQELPRRGQFHYEGTQVVTGARARTAADTEARRRARAREQEPAKGTRPPRAAAETAPSARAPATQPAASSATPAQRQFRFPAAGVLRDARSVHEVREAWRRRTNAATWPTLGERLIYALVAWAPIAVVIGFGGATVTGCADARPGCPAQLETAQAIAIALVLGLLVALPKVAYVATLATVGALFVALAAVATLALLGVDVPLSLEVSALVGFALVAGYAATGALVVLRNATSRPWYAGPRP